MSFDAEYYTGFIKQYRIELITLVITVAASLLLLRKWFAGGKLESAARMDGKVAIVTGGNSGIGLETAKVLANRGARLVLACRSERLGREAARAVAEASGQQQERVQFLQLDLASLQSVREFCDSFCASYSRLDLLVNNAGVMACPEAATADGFELQFGVNHLGHFLLTRRLMPLLKRTGQARVVTVSSIAHSWGKMNWDNLNLQGEYTPFKAYSQSKLANVLFTKALAHKMKEDDVTAYSVHPGAVQTNLGRHLPFIVSKLLAPIAAIAVKRPSEGAQTSLHCALAPIDQLVNGAYYSDCRYKQASKQAESMQDALRLWEISDKLVGASSLD